MSKMETIMSTNPYKDYQNKCAVLGIHPISNRTFNKLINSNKTPVIVGKQGSGKTLLATEIAENHGGYTTASRDEIESQYGLGDLITDNWDTVIVEAETLDRDFVHRMKSLVTGDKIRVQTPQEKPRDVTPPKFIFCTSEPTPTLLNNDNRRFQVVQL